MSWASKMSEKKAKKEISAARLNSPNPFKDLKHELNGDSESNSEEEEKMYDTSLPKSDRSQPLEPLASRDREHGAEPPNDVPHVHGGTLNTVNPFRSPQMPRFSGSGTAEECSSWIRVMSAHLRRQAEMVMGWSPRVELNIALTHLDGDAHTLAERVVRDLGTDASWVHVEEALQERFGVRMSSYALIASLRGVKQGSRSVGEFTTAFENKLDYVMAAGFGDSVTFVSYFIEGLDQNIRAAVMDVLSISETDPWAKVMDMRPNVAVRWVSKLAARREEFTLAMPQFARVMVPHHARAAVVSHHDGGLSRRIDNRGARREELVKYLSQRYKVDPMVMKERLEANLCVACGQPGHVARSCPSTSAVTPSPTVVSPSNSMAR